MKRLTTVLCFMLAACASPAQRPPPTPPTAEDFLRRAECLYAEIARELSVTSKPPYNINSIAVLAAGRCGAAIERKISSQYSVYDPRYVDEPRRDREWSEREALSIAIDMLESRRGSAK